MVATSEIWDGFQIKLKLKNLLELTNITGAYKEGVYFQGKVSLIEEMQNKPLSYSWRWVVKSKLM